MRSSTLKLLSALALGLLMLDIFDQLNVSAMSYPVCLSIVLMGISLRQKPKLVLTISLFYIVLVAFSSLYFLYHSNPYHVPFPNRLFGLAQRRAFSLSFARWPFTSPLTAALRNKCSPTWRKPSAKYPFR